MPYATINYGAPSQYPELSQQFQNIMRQIGAQNAARQQQEQQMWYNAVSGGLGNVADAMRTGYTAQYNRRNQLADQQTQYNQSIDRMRQAQAINSGYNDWSSLINDAQRMGLNPSEAMAYRQAGSETIRGQAQTELLLDRDRRMFEQNYGQAISEKAMQSLFPPVLGQEQIQKAQTGLTKPQQDEFFAAMQQWKTLSAELASPSPRVSQESIIPEIRRQQGIVAGYMQQLERIEPSQQDKFEKSIVTDPITGQRMFPNGRGYDKFEDVPPGMRYERSLQNVETIPDEVLAQHGITKDDLRKQLKDQETQRVADLREAYVPEEYRQHAIYDPKTNGFKIEMPKAAADTQSKELNSAQTDLEQARRRLESQREKALKGYEEKHAEWMMGPKKQYDEYMSRWRSDPRGWGSAPQLPPEPQPPPEITDEMVKNEVARNRAMAGELIGQPQAAKIGDQQRAVLQSELNGLMQAKKMSIQSGIPFPTDREARALEIGKLLGYR